LQSSLAASVTYGVVSFAAVDLKQDRFDEKAPLISRNPIARAETT
jgi:hypothetical protein